MAEKWLDVYQQHFQRYFHKPFDIQVYHSDEPFSDLSGADTAIQAAQSPSAGAIAAANRAGGRGARGSFWRPLWIYLRSLFEPFTPAPKRAGPGGAAPPIGIKLATHDLAMQGFRIYASLGLADQLFRNEQEDFGEVVLFADVPDPEVPRIFVNALFFILQNNVPLGSRFSIGFTDLRSDFVRRYDKTALYFTRPAEEDDPLTEVSMGETQGRVYQAYFITPEEDEFLGLHGADAFEKEFWKQFGNSATDEERFDRSVDEKELQELRRRTARAFCLRRPPCV